MTPLTYYMDWIKHFQLFLLDFDGLLVDTERLHYQAYLRMCEHYQCPLNWTFQEFKNSAHISSEKLRQDIFASLPQLKQKNPNWDVLYQEKKQHYLDVLNEASIELMPGVDALLKALEEKNIKRCVVTNSPKEQIDFIRNKQPVLNSIPYWITREDYKDAKPSPECYLKAIEHYANNDDAIIGFEDSPRGLQALLKTRAKVVMVNDVLPQEVKPWVDAKKVSFFSSFEDINQIA